MEISLILAQEIVKLFLVMIMGYIIVKCNLLKVDDSRTLSVVLVYLVTPCVIIDAFQVNYSPEVRNGLLFAFSMAIGVHIVFIFMTKFLATIFHLHIIEQINIIYTNAGILVIPLINALLGKEYVIYSCGFIVVQIILLWTHCRKLLCNDEHISLKDILLNVNIISIIIGFVLFIFHLSLPNFIKGTLDMTGIMIGPLGMMLAGMVIAKTPILKLFVVLKNYLAVFLRLIAFPIIILAIFIAIGASDMVTDGKNILLTVYLASITPACATVTSMAQLYKKDAIYSSTLYVLTTLLSIITMPLMIYLFDTFI